MTSSASHSAYRILVIDDNVAIHEDFRKILIPPAPAGDKLLDKEARLFGFSGKSFSFAGYTIDSAFQGQEGLEMVRRAKAENQPYLLAFVDGRMPPGWDGIETISRLWEESPELQVVFCTAYADYSWQDIQQNLGETDSLVILKKPFDNVEVLQLAHALTRKWELNREVQGRLSDLDRLVQQSMAEKEQARAFLESAVVHSPSGMIIEDANTGRIRWINPAALDICWLPAPSPSGAVPYGLKPFIQAFHSDGTPYPLSDMPLHRAIRQGEITRDEEFILRNAKGQERWVAANAAPIAAPNGNIIAGILVFQDITQRKQAEKEWLRMQNLLNHSLKMESIGILAGGVAHDFNNLLQAVSGNIELLLWGKPANHPDASRLKTVISTLDRAAKLVQQLLLFSCKIESSKAPVDINQQVQAAARLLKQTIPGMVALELQLDPAVRPVSGDPAQIDQVLVNLVSNAVDAMSEGGKISIETGNVELDQDFVRSHPGATAGPHVLLAVSDTGCGMDEATLKHVFDPFFTTKEMGNGTGLGLGLASVYGIIKAHEGYIQCSSAPGKGAVFSIYLPAVDSTGIAAAKPKPEPVPGGGSETILVVDDEPEIRDLARYALKHFGYTVLSAESGEQALTMFQEQGQAIDLVLLDLNMPGMGGHKCLQELLRLDPQVRVLIASGYSADGQAGEVLTSGARGFIGKPYQIKKLMAMVREALD